MFQSQVAVSEIKRFYKRRKIILWLCPLLLLLLSAGATFIIPPQYESSISIMVERDETLNPMVRFNLAVALASEDRLKSFNEIIYSRSTMNLLIDSLNISEGETVSGLEKEELIKEVRKNIRTELKASNSFTITYSDKYPVRAKKAVELLSSHFIQTKLGLETKRNNQTVDFFKQKLDELKKSVETRETELLSIIQQDVQSTPRENRSLQTDLDRVKDNLDQVNLKLNKTKSDLELVKAVNRGSRDIEAFYEVNLEGLPSGEVFSNLLGSYKNYSNRYTSEFPKVRELKSEIYNAVQEIQNQLESKVFKLESDKTYLKDQYAGITQQIEQTTISERQTNQTKMDYDIYRELYDEMKVKLEQAKTTRDLGENARNQFVVLDPPVVPMKPSKPNKILIVAGGLFLGLILGIVTAAIVEFLDTTIRRPEDVNQFDIPVVAYIPSINMKG
ncbi:MAG: hypothetical protein JJ892_07300 [Balneola sp.]|nr:hypothetical protein [Balneola sp.]MBO6650937.1 hypothetical protein [Balneola sp.]MBO6711879.1 hypothetical protein [Balneola sp.]MBO6800074.1 hypothetical protein [Balneola sp.]MBO6871545.1 hypothetical protein [Balneola sp.]